MADPISLTERRQQNINRQTKPLFKELTNGFDGKFVREFHIPNLVVVAYSESNKETLEDAEVEVASLGYLDEKRNLIVPPMLLDCLSNLFTTSHPYHYRIRPGFVSTINLGLKEMGIPEIKQGHFVRLEAPAIYVWHYDRDVILKGDPGWAKK